MRKRRRWIGWHFDRVKRAGEAGNAEGKPPRYEKKRHFTVGRGPVPRHRSHNPTLAGETRSDARVTSEGPRTTGKNAPPLTVGRGPVPRHRSRARPCSSGSPDPELFVIRRAQTTEAETHIMMMGLAGDRPPRYGKIETRRSLLRVCIEI